MTRRLTQLHPIFRVQHRSDVVDCVGEGDVQLDPPEHTLEGAKGAIAEFIRYYGIEEGMRDKGEGTAKKRRFWSDALEADSDVDEELL